LGKRQISPKRPTGYPSALGGDITDWGYLLFCERPSASKSVQLAISNLIPTAFDPSAISFGKSPLSMQSRFCTGRVVFSEKCHNSACNIYSCRVLEREKPEKLVALLGISFLRRSARSPNVMIMRASDSGISLPNSSSAHMWIFSFSN
jgi:hypothetical protein